MCTHRHIHINLHPEKFCTGEIAQCTGSLTSHGVSSSQWKLCWTSLGGWGFSAALTVPPCAKAWRRLEDPEQQGMGTWGRGRSMNPTCSTSVHLRGPSYPVSPSSASSQRLRPTGQSVVSSAVLVDYSIGAGTPALGAERSKCQGGELDLAGQL